METGCNDFDLLTGMSPVGLSAPPKIKRATKEYAADSTGGEGIDGNGVDLRVRAAVFTWLSVRSREQSGPASELGRGGECHVRARAGPASWA